MKERRERISGKTFQKEKAANSSKHYGEVKYVLVRSSALDLVKCCQEQESMLKRVSGR